MAYRCDGCGKDLKRGDLRYTVRIDVRAAYDTLEIGLVDLVQDHEAEIKRLIEQLAKEEAQEVEESVYKLIQLDLCPSCQKAYIRSPLRFHPENTGLGEGIDIDEFFRSLGYGSEGEPDREPEGT